MTINLPRLSTAGAIVTVSGNPTVHLVQWWNALASQIEGNLTALATQQAQIDAALGIAGGASSGATSAAAQAALATQLAAELLSPIPNGDLLANTSGGAAVPVGNALSAVLDIVLGNAQGDVMFRGAVGWKVLAPGTAGQKLTTGGAAADVSWT